SMSGRIVASRRFRGDFAPRYASPAGRDTPPHRVRLILPSTCGYLPGRDVSPLPRRAAMLPIEIIAFPPVVVLGLAFFSLILGAAAGGVWEDFEEGAAGRSSDPGKAAPQAATPEREHSRAA